MKAAACLVAAKQVGAVFSMPSANLPLNSERAVHSYLLAERFGLLIYLD